mmetsp:Transcript_22565/g.59578  ORF Transcript_22565/g.59578 Transcript_22565/m.59578 type:complete len:287 (+) Transcript_22565:477-1337(+)
MEMPSPQPVEHSLHAPSIQKGISHTKLSTTTTTGSEKVNLAGKYEHISNPPGTLRSNDSSEEMTPFTKEVPASVSSNAPTDTKLLPPLAEISPLDTTLLQEKSAHRRYRPASGAEVSDSTRLRIRILRRKGFGGKGRDSAPDKTRTMDQGSTSTRTFSGDTANMLATEEIKRSALVSAQSTSKTSGVLDHIGCMSKSIMTTRASFVGAPSFVHAADTSQKPPHAHRKPTDKGHTYPALQDTLQTLPSARPVHSERSDACVTTTGPHVIVAVVVVICGVGCVAGCVL